VSGSLAAKGSARSTPLSCSTSRLAKAATTFRLALSVWAYQPRSQNGVLNLFYDQPRSGPTKEQKLMQLGKAKTILPSSSSLPLPKAHCLFLTNPSKCPLLPSPPLRGKTSPPSFRSRPRSDSSLLVSRSRSIPSIVCRLHLFSLFHDSSIL
jgi:hypothetical protein